MLLTVGDIRSELLVRLGVSSTSAFYSDAIVNSYLNTAHQFCAGFKKWPMVEGRNSTTYVANTEEWNYPEGFKSDSVRYLSVGGKSFRKTDFAQYQRYREDFSSGTKKIFSDFGRILFINPKADVSGTLTAYGQFLPAELDTSVPTTATIFTDNEQEGNVAMLEEMLSYAYQRERDYERVRTHHLRAIEILEQMWTRYADEQFGYHSTPGDEGMWKRTDILNGALREDSIQRDRWY